MERRKSRGEERRGEGADLVEDDPGPAHVEQPRDVAAVARHLAPLAMTHHSFACDLQLFCIKDCVFFRLPLLRRRRRGTCPGPLAMHAWDSLSSQLFDPAPSSAPPPASPPLPPPKLSLPHPSTPSLALARPLPLNPVLRGKGRGASGERRGERGGGGRSGGRGGKRRGERVGERRGERGRRRRESEGGRGEES